MEGEVSHGPAAAIDVHEMRAIVSSDTMRKVMAMVQKVARSSAAVLITGETGCGKEVIARAVHSQSLRCNKPWIDVNCAALPEHLVESELFGYEKGAFSGADSPKQGLFEMADKGTLFLDEIGELEPKIQVKLLRVLDGIPYYRLGGSRKVAVDVRIIAATNRPLEEAVASGRFRSDLYHRLCQFQLKVPPLRERPEDIEALSAHFLQEQNPDLHFSADAMRALKRYSWPGNVRELKNMILQAVVASEGNTVELKDLPPEIAASVDLVQAAAATPDSAEVAGLEELERRAILTALARNNGHQGLAAEQLGISRRTLSRKLKQYKIEMEAEPADDTGGAPARLGSLSEEQQECYRVTSETTVQVRAQNGAQIQAKSLNISAGGVAVSGVDTPFKFTGPLEVEMTLPDGPPIHVQGELAWADVYGKAGIRFKTMDPATRTKFKDWLRRKQTEEGWEV